jgi:hypothetical protein
LEVALPELETELPVISLGTFCLTDQIIKFSFGDHARYPFDDIFSSSNVVRDCLENDFGTFLDFANLQMADNELTWIQRPYVEKFDEVRTIAHYDMRLPKNHEKFNRRVARLRALYGRPGSLFLYIGYAERVEATQLLSMYHVWQSLFANCDLLAILIGAPTKELDSIKGLHDNLKLRFYSPISHVEGTKFIDHRDNYALVDMVKAARTALSQRLDGIS